ncbi:alpha/beta fold hydrolase [Actinoallomurus sp. NPDC052308]|uniref:alpha/beta fold hydrolase n=1 Tax=Actinoallomurus sp. NPDC052308 TaxID=3155530 RepID=UPI003431E1AF
MDAVVIGATGLLGRWLVLELLNRNRAVAAIVRGRETELRDWLRDRGADPTRLTVVRGEITEPGLGLTAADDETLGDVRDVFNAAAVYRFGLDRETARKANVDGALHVLDWAATRPRLRRLIHVSGYRVGLDPAPTYPIPAAELDALYRARGAYDASKTEADAAVRVTAARRGVPLTVVNPSTVIGHSGTGEAGQYIGLAELVQNLWAGRLPALAGTPRTFVPVVPVDYFARLTAAIPEHDPEPGGLHWILDEATPNLPELVRLLAEHLGVRAPRRLVPLPIVRRLPRAVSRVEPETLTFLTEDRYDTGSADKVAAAAGLTRPPVRPALRHWADRLVADRFGAAESPLPGGFHEVAGARTYLAGDRTAPRYVLLHGLPLDGEAWAGVIGELAAPALVTDLPGLGRSGLSAATEAEWLAELLAPLRTRPVIVAHSAAAAPALRFAAAHPDRVDRLVLVSPYFLQRPAPRFLRVPALATPLLRRSSSERLATALLGAPSPHPAIESARAQLRRPGVARRTARRLALAHRPAERASLRNLLATAPVPVRLIVGELDPLVDGTGDVPVSTVAEAGHHPLITHPDAVAAGLDLA